MTSLIDEAAHVDGDLFLKMLESRGYVSRAALLDLGTGFVDGQEWLAVRALRPTQTIAPRAVGEVALYTCEMAALTETNLAKIETMRKLKWQILALPTSRSILMVLSKDFVKPTP
jgi:hypothetical protein